MARIVTPVDTLLAFLDKTYILYIKAYPFLSDRHDEIIFFARALLGLAESPNFPGLTRAVSDCLPEHERTQALWSKWAHPDENNCVSLACRALLIQDDDKNILLETGVGTFFDLALRERYGVEEEQHVLLDSLEKVGLSDKDIDFAILSHLHFDHEGGLLSSWSADKKQTLLFPKANFLVSQGA